jgi:hypothetical protein
MDAAALTIAVTDPADAPALEAIAEALGLAEPAR